MAKTSEKKRSLSEIRSTMKRIEKVAAKPAKSDELARETDALLAALRHSLEDVKKQGFKKDLTAAQEALRVLEEHAKTHLGYVPKGPIREYAESIGVAVLVALLLRSFVVEPFKIPTGSMIPTLLVGDHIFVSKFTYGLRIPFTEIFMVEFARPSRGEVVVFTFPVLQARDHVTRNRGLRGCIDEESLTVPKDFIKRIIGLPGDVVEIREGRLHLNGTALPRQLVAREPTGSFMAPLETRERETSGEHTYTIQYRQSDPDFGPIKVRENHFFVMGDHRDNSSDSRCWGQVPMENVKGRSIFIWLSLSDEEDEFVRWNRFGTRIH